MPQEQLPPEFDKLYQKFLDLHKDIVLGQLDSEEFQAALENLNLNDKFGGEWRLSKDGNWYFNNGIEWVQRDPQSLYPKSSHDLKKEEDTLEPNTASSEIEKSPGEGEKPSPEKKSGNRKIKWIYILIPVVVIICCLCVMLFWYFWDDSDSFIDDGIQNSEETQTQAYASTNDTIISHNEDQDVRNIEVLLSDQQQTVFDDFGWPDAFILVEMDNLQDEPIRHEIWHYYLAQTSFLFSNGVFISDSEVEMPPAGILPTPYTPDQFPVGVSLEEIQTLMGDVSFKPVKDSELIQEGFQLYAGDKILLGFVDDQLVYVEALAVLPEGSE
jgi:hypothetical protein